jgi:hypothetical protein
MHTAASSACLDLRFVQLGRSVETQGSRIENNRGSRALGLNIHLANVVLNIPSIE